MKKRDLSQSLKLLLVLTVLLINLSASAQGLKANGKKIVNANGDEVLLRGMGLGGWMLQEPYMMEMSGFAGTQWQIKNKISSLIGVTNMEAFYDAWRANHCTRGDIDSLASWGFNSVRLPIHYNLYTLPIEDEPVPGENTWFEKGFAMTDSLIAWCKADHIYVILDLHAAPGGEGKDYAISDGNPAHLSLWESDANKNKTIALWRKLAKRYANEPWVGGYDLLNEPNWGFTTTNANGCGENSNAPLTQLYKDITNAIRQVDTTHMIIIEGNCWGNNYNGIAPTWDKNMALSFHKYWSYNDQGSIQGIINLRNQYNKPIWMGESGENSNVWFTDAIRLVEANGIGWAWWPLKKINSVVNPLTIVKTPEYQTLLNYWKNGGIAPTVDFATNALMQMAENANIRNCIYRKDVTDAMFRQISDSTTKPFASNDVPGIIAAPDYDLGRNGRAYFDNEVADYHVTTGTSTAWNTGYAYRNDGVDIEPSSDVATGANGFNVGWTKDNEFLQYTANVDSSAVYSVTLRYGALSSGCKMWILVNNADVTGAITVPATGGYSTWANLVINDIILYKGQQKIKILFEKGGANLSTIGFTLQKKIEDVSVTPVSAETYLQTELIYLSFNKILVESTVKVENFTCTVNGNMVVINSLTINSANPAQVIFSLGEKIYDIDDIKINYTGGILQSTDGSVLQDFSNFPVKNNLPVYTVIPGKIEAESFSLNRGLSIETCTDTGGGQDLGYTNNGDYLEYRVRVLKTAKYNLEVRIASGGTAGKMEVQQLNSTGTVINTVTVNIPVTGGWQAWQTVTASVDLTEGAWTMRVKILQMEFNINWYKFSESITGIDDEVGSVFSIFPNPANQLVSVMVPGSSGHKKIITLRSSSGSFVRSVEASDSEISKKFNVGDLPRGLYFVELQMEGKIVRNKLVLQ